MELIREYFAVVLNQGTAEPSLWRTPKQCTLAHANKLKQLHNLFRHHFKIFPTVALLAPMNLGNIQLQKEKNHPQTVQIPPKIVRQIPHFG